MAIEGVTVGKVIDYSFIDPNMRRLVRAMNALPGIRTMGSCGGHDNPGPTQQPAGHWFISFRVAVSRGGMRSLESVAALSNYTGGKQGARVEAAASGMQATGRSLWFALIGEQVDPDRAAELLEGVMSIEP
jgi:hypothetical protein